MRAISISAFLLVAVPVFGQLTELTPENWDKHVPAGKEVDAIYGDVAIANGKARGIVAATTVGRKANMTVQNVTGGLIDFTSRVYENDLLAAFFPGRRKFPLREMRAGPDRSVVVLAKGTKDRPAYETRYHMEPGQPVINITSTWTNTTNTEIVLHPQDDLRIDGRNEDLFRTTPGVEAMFWIEDVHWHQSYGIRAAGFDLKIDGSTRETVLQYRAKDGNPIKLAPGETWTFTRQIIAAKDLPEVWAIHDELTGAATSCPVVITLSDSIGKPIAGARLKFSSDTEIRGTSVTNDEGIATLRLPPGEWKIDATFAGIPVPELDKLSVTVVAGGNTVEIQTAADIGHVVANITDGLGNAIPAKVQFTGSDSRQTPDWGPPTGEYFVGNLAYTANGKFNVPMLAGSYDVIVSHGPEYEAVFTKLSVTRGDKASLTASLQRTVKTPGWVSSDFHSHSTPSGDNTGSQLGRVLNLAAEHIEFAPCTEHNRVSTYDNHIKVLGLKPYLATVSGMELTGQPLPLNHQNVFPMVRHPRTQDGGGPLNDSSPETQIERLAAWDGGSEKLIVQDHPDLGWLFYDKNGDGNPDEGHERSFNLIDVIEIHPIDRVLKIEQFELRGGKVSGNHRILNWLQLLNQGFRMYGVVNTDAHYNFHGSGGLRNWIQSSTDEPAKIDSDEMRKASETGRLVMSNGPYLEATFQAKGAGERFVSGQDMLSESGEVTIDVRVQCSNWIDIDTLFVLINGKASGQHTYTRATHAGMFRDGTVKFKHKLTVRLKEDSHLVVVTGHSIQKLGAVMGPQWGGQNPAALSNPVFVDVDGGGFQPNMDTLGFPLPVKFEKTVR